MPCPIITYVQCPWWPEEGDRSPGPGVRGRCELYNMGAGNGTQVSGRVASVLNVWPTSAAWKASILPFLFSQISCTFLDLLVCSFKRVGHFYKWFFLSAPLCSSKLQFYTHHAPWRSLMDTRSLYSFCPFVGIALCSSGWPPTCKSPCLHFQSAGLPSMNPLYLDSPSLLNYFSISSWIISPAMFSSSLI